VLPNLFSSGGSKRGHSLLKAGSYFTGSSSNDDAMGIMTEKVEDLNRQLAEKVTELTECRQTMETMVNKILKNYNDGEKDLMNLRN